MSSNIEWTDETWNPVTGCTRASAGCDHCYAVTMTYRLEAMGRSKYAGLTVVNAKGDRHFNGEVRTHDDSLTIPLRWRNPRVVFVNSMSDLFHRDVPFEFIDKVFAVMALTPQHTYQILTKRPERMAGYFLHRSGCLGIPTYERVGLLMDQPDWIKLPAGRTFDRRYPDWPLPNVWLGTSVEDQQRADERIPHLLKCPAAVRFLSAEPLLSDLNLRRVKCIGAGFVDALDGRGHDGSPTGGEYFKDDTSSGGIDWVIVGGESGHGARPFKTDWARSIIAQCRAAGVACFVKQLGSAPFASDYVGCSPPLKLRSKKGGDTSEWDEDLRVRQMPEMVGNKDRSGK